MRIINSKEHKRTGGIRFLHTTAAVLTAAALSLGCPFTSLADAAGTVTVESAKIRRNTDTASDVVGSVARGAQVSIKDEINDASGTLWYQVYVNADTTGYVRADLIQKESGGAGGMTLAAAEGTPDNGSQTDMAQGDGEQEAGTGNQAEDAMDAQYANVSVEAAKIRSGPSTNDAVVERLVKDTQVVVSGQSTGSSDGKVWYFITFTGTDGAEKTGYVRSDLVTLGDMVPVPEEQPEPEAPAEPEPQETVSQDYEVVLRDGEWYLLDHIGGFEHKLQPLLDATQQQNETMEEDAKKLVRQRIAIVVLGVLAAALLIVVIVMAIKLRDVYYEEYEDDEDDEEEEDDDTEDDEEEEEVPVRRRRRADEESNVRNDERPARRSVRDMEPQTSRRTPRETDSRREQAVDPRERAAAKRKSKNFLLDDDEFEFEFLNMDDKDL